MAHVYTRELNRWLPGCDDFSAAQAAASGPAPQTTAAQARWIRRQASSSTAVEVA